MSGFIAINRSISQAVQYEILKESGRNEFIALCIGVGLVSIFLYDTILIPVIALGILIYVYFYRKNKNNKLYNLLKNGIVTKISLEYIISKEKVVNNKGKIINLYFYKLKYFDLNEREHISKVSFRELLSDEMLHDIPLIFSAANPKLAIILHEKFKGKEKNKDGLLTSSKLQLIDNKIDFRVNS